MPNKWNYRVIKHIDAQSDETSFQIHEVYYSEIGEIEAWTETAVEPYGETIESLKWEIRRFLEATEKPVLRIGSKTLVPDETMPDLNE